MSFYSTSNLNEPLLGNAKPSKFNKKPKQRSWTGTFNQVWSKIEEEKTVQGNFFHICNSQYEYTDIDQVAKHIGEALNKKQESEIPIQLFDKIVNYFLNLKKVGVNIEKEYELLDSKINNKATTQKDDRKIMVEEFREKQNLKLQCDKWFKAEWKKVFDTATEIDKSQFAEYLCKIQSKFWGNDKANYHEEAHYQFHLKKLGDENCENLKIKREDIFTKMKILEGYTPYFDVFKSNNWNSRAIVLDKISLCTTCKKTAKDGLMLKKVFDSYSECFDCVCSLSQGDFDVESKVPCELMQELHYINQKNQSKQTMWPEYKCSFNNYFQGYWDQLGWKPTFKNREIDEDYPYGIMPRWKHIKILEIQQGKMGKKRYIKQQNQQNYQPELYWIFPHNLMVYSSFEEKKKLKEKEYHFVFRDYYSKLNTKEFEAWIKDNKEQHKLSTHPLLKYDYLRKCVCFGSEDSKVIKILIHETVELSEQGQKDYQLIPASNPYYCHNLKCFRMEYFLMRKHSGGIVISKWTLMIEWKGTEPQKLQVVEHELIIGTKVNLFPILKEDWLGEFTGGYRLSGFDCEIPKLKPHEFLVQSPLMLGCVRQYKCKKDDITNHTVVHLLVLTSRLTDDVVYSQEEELSNYHHQKMLWNCTRNLLNGVPDDSISILGNKTENIEITLKGLLQPHYMFDCMSKLHQIIFCNNLQELLDEERLTKEREDTILDFYLSKNKQIEEQIIQAIERLNMRAKPYEIMLDICFSHPVIDTCNFTQPSKAKILRQIVINYILKNGNCASHLDLMCSLIGYIMEPDNGMEIGMLFFKNIVEDTGDKMSLLVQQLLFTEDQYKSLSQTGSSSEYYMFRIPLPQPEEHIKDLIVKMYQDKEQDQGQNEEGVTEQMYFFFDLNRAFLAYKLSSIKLNMVQAEMFSQQMIFQKLSKEIQNQFKNEWQKNYSPHQIFEELHVHEPRVFKSFKHYGFSDDLEVSKFLERASELSDTHLQDMEILKIMIKEQFEYTQKIQFRFFIMYTLGYFIPINWQMNLSEEHNPNYWFYSKLMLITCFFTQTIMLMIEVAQFFSLDDYFKYANNYVDLLQILVFYVYLYKRLNHPKDIIPGYDKFEATDSTWVFWNNFLSICAFLKFLLFIRMWVFLLKLVILLYKVTLQLIPFILFFLMLDFQVAYMYHLSGVTLKFNDNKEFDDYPDVNKYIALFIQQLRNSMGDISAMNYHEYWKGQENMHVTYWIWIIFIITQIITQLIFLNFVIAQINESYLETVMYQETVILQMQIDLNIETQVLLKFFKCCKKQQKENANFCFLIQAPKETDKSVRDKAAEFVHFTINNSYKKQKTLNLELHRCLHNKLEEMRDKMVEDCSQKMEESNRKMMDICSLQITECTQKMEDNCKKLEIRLEESLKVIQDQFTKTSNHLVEAVVHPKKSTNDQQMMKQITESLLRLEQKMEQQEKDALVCQNLGLKESMKQLVKTNKVLQQRLNQLEQNIEKQPTPEDKSKTILSEDLPSKLKILEQQLLYQKGQESKQSEEQMKSASNKYSAVSRTKFKPVIQEQYIQPRNQRSAKSAQKLPQKYYNSSLSNTYAPDNLYSPQILKEADLKEHKVLRKEAYSHQSPNQLNQLENHTSHYACLNPPSDQISKKRMNGSAFKQKSKN